MKCIDLPGTVIPFHTLPTDPYVVPYSANSHQGSQPGLQACTCSYVATSQGRDRCRESTCLQTPVAVRQSDFTSAESNKMSLPIF